MAFREWQVNDERRALALSGTLRLHRALVHFDQAFDDGKSESQTSVAACCGSVGLSEALEDEWQEARVDALSAVADTDFHAAGPFAINLAREDRDHAIRRGEFDGVGEEVPQNLLQPSRVAVNRTRLLDRGVQAHILRIGAGLHSRNGCVDHGGQIHPLQFHRQLARQNPAHVEQILHHARLEFGIAVDDLDALRHGPGAAILAQNAGPAHDGIQGGT